MVLHLLSFPPMPACCAVGPGNDEITACRCTLTASPNPRHGANQMSMLDVAAAFPMRKRSTAELLSSNGAFRC